MAASKIAAVCTRIAQGAGAPTRKDRSEKLEPVSWTCVGGDHQIDGLQCATTERNVQNGSRHTLRRQCSEMEIIIIRTE